MIRRKEKYQVKPKITDGKWIKANTERQRQKKPSKQGIRKR